ncbi:MAG: hypothetical protein HYX77_08420 [Acidobacteria bacterium]|nr:hypothetical protein [Acidobacteriota bacterium]
MPSGVVRRARSPLLLLLVVSATAAGCSANGVFKQKYEYEEELYLSLDGSATLNVNASVASLVALRGANFDPDPRARIDRNRVRALFEGEGARVSVSLARRDLRRFVHASVRADDVRQLSRLAPFAWSAYRFDRRDDIFEFRQIVGPSAGGKDGAIQWTGEELVAFRMHLPSEILFHNAPSGDVERGNILEWEQPLSDRLAGRPVDIEVDLESESILYTTLLLFGFTIVAAVAALALVIWRIARRGREGEIVEPPPPAPARGSA